MKYQRSTLSAALITRLQKEGSNSLLNGWITTAGGLQRLHLRVERDNPTVRNANFNEERLLHAG